MGIKEVLIFKLVVKVIKKIKLLEVLKKIAEKTENEVDDMLVNLLITAIELTEQYYLQDKPIEELEVE